MEKKGFVYVGVMLVLMAASFAWINREKETAKSKVYPVRKMEPIHLTKAEFLSKVANFEKNPTEWKYLGDKPCIVDFYASWCGPCKMVAPILEDLAKEYDGQLYIYKVDVDAEQEIAAAYGIQSIPTIFFCPVTGTPQTAQGAMPKESFKKMINGVLLKK
ncbi:MAG: thioredoxin [Bacteroidota bacterium]|nr:thioredoxin [Bacteroidota bacterium]